MTQQEKLRHPDAERERSRLRCRYVRCKVTSREVTGFRQEWDKVLRYFEALLFFVFIRRKVHFITVTLQRCYKYDDREKAMRRYLDVFSEATVGENWTCVHTKWRSFFADLCNVSELPVLKMQKHVWIYWSDSTKNPGGRQDFSREVYM